MSTVTWSGATGLFNIPTNNTAAAPTSGSAMSGIVQNSELWKTVGLRSFWSNHMSDGMSNIIQVKRDFTKTKGDLMYFQLALADSESPIDNTYEAWGNEEDTSVYSDNVLLGLARHAKKIDVPMTEQRAVFNARELMRSMQEQWWIEYGIDKWITRKMSGLDYFDDGGTTSGTDTIGEAATANTNVMYGGDANGTGDIDSTDVLTLELLFKAREAAQMGYIGTSAKRKIFPVQLQTGGMGYKFIGHPYQIWNLMRDPDWKEAWQMDVRGQNTMLIKGEGNVNTMPWTPIARINDIEIWEYPNIITYSTWGSSGDVSGAVGLFCGAQAGFLATCKDPEWIEEVGMYSEYFGVMVRVFMGFDKATFNSIDNGVIAIKTAAANHYTNL